MKKKNVLKHCHQDHNLQILECFLAAGLEGQAALFPTWTAGSIQTPWSRPRSLQIRIPGRCSTAASAKNSDAIRSKWCHSTSPLTGATLVNTRDLSNKPFCGCTSHIGVVSCGLHYRHIMIVNDAHKWWSDATIKSVTLVVSYAIIRAINDDHNRVYNCCLTYNDHHLWA